MKKSELTTMIRKIVKEEIANTSRKYLTETKMKQIAISNSADAESHPSKSTVSFTKNKVLNEVLNETKQNIEWETMGGKTFTTDSLNDVMQKSYGNIGGYSNHEVDMVESLGVNPQAVPDHISKALNRDYTDVMKKIEEKNRNI